MEFLPKFIVRTPLNSTSNNDIDSVFLEALYLSTPTLYEEYQKHLTKPLTDSKELKKMNVSLYKYQTRARTRCTPFGLFAGLSIGAWENKNSFMQTNDLKQFLSRRTRLDMNVLCSLAQEFAKKPFIKPYLKFYPNTSIYLIGDSYRYIEYYYLNNVRFYKISKVDFSEYLKSILEKTKNGLTCKQLVDLLISEENNEEEANGFINELIDEQLLVNQLEPTVTGTDYFDTLLMNLNSINSSDTSEDLNQLLSILNNVDELIKIIDKNIFNNIEIYKEIQRKLKTILPLLEETNLFQTDLYKAPPSIYLNKELQTQLKNVIQFLNKINPITPNLNLEEFKKRFYERYEDYEIPLLSALDIESGIGYPVSNNSGINDLIDDVYIPKDPNVEINLKWDIFQSQLLKLVTDSLKLNKKVIKIDENDFKNNDHSTKSLPSSLYAMFKLLDKETNKIKLGAVGGSSAITLLGRFAGGNNELTDIVKYIADFEQTQSPDKIFAEIVHLPESRTGNILARTKFRKYEIPYLAKSSTDVDYSIKMEDLTLKMRNNYIILFDKRLGKEIIPRLGNAHNYSLNSLPVYHFLCDIQTQYYLKSFLGFNLGVLGNQFKFLPRVEYQNTVLSAARWQLTADDIKPFKDKKLSENEKIELFFKLKESIELPDKFLIIDNDNELLIDCANPIAINAFFDSLKTNKEIRLEEYLFCDEKAFVNDTLGKSYTNECIAIILNENNNQERAIDIPKLYKSRYMFSIGSEWLFYKIYSGVKTADYILTEKLKNITEILYASGAIDKWFFIRYADPDPHLRFRLHISDLKKYSDVLLLINKELEPLIVQNIVSKIQTDTYRRELERYGDNSIELAERLFNYDSIFVTDMLSMLDSDTGGTIRWQIAIRSVDAFLNDFKLTDEEKYKLIDSLNTSFFNEHGGKKELKISLDNKFRVLRSKIEGVLNKANDFEKEYYPIIELLNKRSIKNSNVVHELLKLRDNKQLQVTFSALLASLLHMNLDRLFMSLNRTNEFVVYDLLFRYYKSSLARSKGESKNPRTVNL